MNPSLARARHAFALVAFVMLVLPASALAAQTFGSDLENSPDQQMNCGVTCTLMQNQLSVADQASGGIAAPASGVITRWRVKVGTVILSPNLPSIGVRVMRSGGGGAYSAVASSEMQVIGATNANSTLTFTTRLPVQTGDRLGARCCLGDGFAFFMNDLGAGNTSAGFSYWTTPDLADGGSADTPDGNSDPKWELLINADIEPDADGDGFGDESQDGCAGTSGENAGCPVVASPGTGAGMLAPVNADTSPPVLRFGAQKKQDVDRLFVSLLTYEPAQHTLTATVRLPGKGGGSTIRYRAKTVTTGANQRSTVSLKLTRRDLRRVKRSLRAGNRLYVMVTDTAIDSAANASMATRRVRLTD